jgi:hypothetical protein
MSLLIKQGADGPLKSAAAAAKRLLTSSKFERLILVDSMSRDKELSKSIIDVLSQMSSQAMAAAPSENHIKKWLKIESASLEAERQLAANANPKLVLMNLVLNL